MTKPALAPAQVRPPETAGLVAVGGAVLRPVPAHEPASGPLPTKRAVLYLRVSTARQAGTNGEAEGYSIPKQRDQCVRKAHELGAEVIEEFVDAGASARSANRPELQRMLAILEQPGSGIDYVIVHKVDRLARDRADDVQIMMAIRKAGATLVSVAEAVDETPSGRLMHGMLASMAEYYSANLANEAKKGMAQKAKSGGTHGVAPIGYLNTLERVGGREIKGIAIDEERADHIRWAFRAYATGDWSVSNLRDALAERGLKSRTTRKYEGGPLAEAQVHRMLGKPYYIGKIVYKGVILDGAHEPLIDEPTWFKVQDVLAGRRLSGDRSWRHTHYLKGSLVCRRCKGRMGYGVSKGRGGGYQYVFCLGRHTGRTDCDLPYVPVEKVEQAVRGVWRREVSFSEEIMEALSKDARQQLDEHFRSSDSLAKKQAERLKGLERTKQRLIDAYLAEAIPVDDLRERQLDIAREISDAKALIESAQHDRDLLTSRLEMVLRLASNAAELYDAAPEEAKKWLNQAIFERIEIDLEDEFEQPAEQSAPESICVADGVFSDVAAAVLEALGRPEAGNARTPASLTATEGSNVTHLAETEGFEPSEPVRVLHLSRVVHSTGLCDVSRKLPQSS
jgi:site-specific DNA recombinase